MPTALITGSSGLIGSCAVRHFYALGWRACGLDNNARRGFFGPDGDTTHNKAQLCAELPSFLSYNGDICNRDAVETTVKVLAPDLVIHAAAQPSHDYAAAHPFEDFETNAGGTLNLLEAVRRHAPGAAFVFLSTNKVYGDAPNRIRLEELRTRYDYFHNGTYAEGLDETLTIDASTHSLFGCSKLAADVYVQEYGRYFGLRTVCFRCGCLTGGAHAGAEQHGFLAYLAKCSKEGRPYKVYGYKGKQVRDQLHAADVAQACEEFYLQPRAGEVYNLGGGRENSISVLEAITEIEQRTGKRLAWEYIDEPRRGDHICWVTDTGKFRGHYPGWRVRVPLGEILDEICGVQHGQKGDADSGDDDQADTPAARSHQHTQDGAGR